ncbi:MAG: flotillin family protein, partial [Flavobacteriales bacterium]|nr:flotillin family protein [Flavobacteriales bacterium]
ENGGGKDGKTSTSNFISGMYKSVPPLQEMFNMAGMQLPNYLKGEDIEDAKEVKANNPNRPSNPKPRRPENPDSDI